MAHVGRLRRLRSLSLNGCKAVTDVGLGRLVGLTELRSLDLGFTGVKGPGLSVLEGMDRLKTLSLMRVPATDAGDLAHLRVLDGGSNTSNSRGTASRMTAWRAWRG